MPAMHPCGQTLSELPLGRTSPSLGILPATYFCAHIGRIAAWMVVASQFWLSH